jgi:hypothetical protein
MSLYCLSIHVLKNGRKRAINMPKCPPSTAKVHVRRHDRYPWWVQHGRLELLVVTAVKMVFCARAHVIGCGCQCLPPLTQLLYSPDTSLRRRNSPAIAVARNCARNLPIP